MIVLDDVVVRLGDVEALRGATLAVDARTVAVIGENGSGKSTFARLVAGLTTAASGTVRVLGLDPEHEIHELRRRVAMVFSNPDAQIVMPTVAEDVAFSIRGQRPRRGARRRSCEQADARLRTSRFGSGADGAGDGAEEAGGKAGGTGDRAGGTGGKAGGTDDGAEEAADRVAQTLERFGLAALAERPAHDLSGGQKQLLALAGAFIRHPDLVVADEPTAYLDARNARLVADHLLADAGHRLVLATHDLALARRCEAAVLFREGRVQELGEPATIIARYEASLQC